MEGNRVTDIEFALLIGELRRDLQALTLRVARLEGCVMTQGYTGVERDSELIR
jgi:hypothetical protein